MLKRPVLKKKNNNKNKTQTTHKYMGRFFHSYMGRSVTAQAHGLHSCTVRSHPYNKGLQLLSPFYWMKCEEFSRHTPVTNAWSARRNLSSIGLWATSHHLFLGMESYEAFLVLVVSSKSTPLKSKERGRPLQPQSIRGFCYRGHIFLHWRPKHYILFS